MERGFIGRLLYHINFQQSHEDHQQRATKNCLRGDPLTTQELKVCL